MEKLFPFFVQISMLQPLCIITSHWNLASQWRFHLICRPAVVYKQLAYCTAFSVALILSLSFQLVQNS